MRRPTLPSSAAASRDSGPRSLRRREPSCRVVLVEAGRCGDGPSGRNGGFLHGYWASLARLRARLGDDGALTVAHAADGAIPAVQELGEATRG
jgi:glycine/D-amino acid oxidase-like deaminating enzyme